MPKENGNMIVQKHFFDLLFQVQLHMKEVVQDADSGLSPLQIMVMRTLVSGNDMSLIDVANTIGRDKSQITRIIQDLEKKGIVTKQRSEKDKRAFVLTVNEEVRSNVSFFINKENELVDKMLAGIPSSKLQDLGENFEQMLKNLQEE